MALKSIGSVKSPTLGEKKYMYWKLDNFLIRMIPQKDFGTGQMIEPEVRILLKGYEDEEAKNNPERASNMDIEVSFKGEDTEDLKELLDPFIEKCYKKLKIVETEEIEEETEEGEKVKKIKETRKIPNYDWEDV